MSTTQCANFGCNVIEVVGGTFAVACIFADHHEISWVTSEAGCCKTVPTACTGHIANRTVHSYVGIVVSNITSASGNI